MSIETLIETYTRHIKRNEQQIVELQKEKKAAKEKRIISRLISSKEKYF